MDTLTFTNSFLDVELIAETVRKVWTETNLENGPLSARFDPPRNQLVRAILAREAWQNANPVEK